MTMAYKTPKEIKKFLLGRQNEIIKLDLSGGLNPQHGFINIDYVPSKNVDIVFDLQKYPWPLPEDFATLIMAGGVVSHISRENFGFIKFMDECWKALKLDGQLMISTPYAGTTAFWTEPTNVNGCTAQTWMYFDPLAGDGNGNPYNLYKRYKPKPWKIERCFFQADGNIEVLLSKRREDPSYTK